MLLQKQLGPDPRDSQRCWQLFKEAALIPAGMVGPEPEADSLLITMGFQSPAQERLTFKFTRQLLLASADEIQSGLQLQCQLQYEATQNVVQLCKRLKALTRLGSWAFATKNDFLNYAENLAPFQELLRACQPVTITVTIEDLLA